ncbi:MAG: histidine kinase [Gammaproteobacteria bacterium]|nr:histidine kinase [Gammaproteobacteria bacterium]MDH5777276.1 histidine kinase [Gammaproteobacteria bacterium]
MKLAFKHQFILAPLVVVVLLVCLVGYALFELANISRKNEVTRYWELLTDDVQSVIVAANRLNNVIGEMSKGGDAHQDEQFFSYLEQARIVSGILLEPFFLEQIPSELRANIKAREKILRAPERSNPAELGQFLSQLLPMLEYQSKIFAAQRRTDFIDSHRTLIEINSRMSTSLIAGLLICIFLAATLALWGLSINRKRLKNMSERALAACSFKASEIPDPDKSRDELDALEQCLVNMTQRLLHVVSVENVLHGVENERRRIAMDMHDGVLADLTAINRKLDAGTATAEEIESLRKDVNGVINQLREIIDDLHPQVLETLGLEAALNSFLNRHRIFEEFENVHFDFDEKIENTLTLEQKINIFRIITEAVNNVIKHARCDRFEVSFRLVTTMLHITVEDNGIGMSEQSNPAGHGSANILERARLLGADVQWRTSRFATGTCFELKLLVAKAES